MVVVCWLGVLGNTVEFPLGKVELPASARLEQLLHTVVVGLGQVDLVHLRDDVAHVARVCA